MRNILISHSKVLDGAADGPDLRDAPLPPPALASCLRTASHPASSSQSRGFRWTGEVSRPPLCTRANSCCPRQVLRPLCSSRQQWQRKDSRVKGT